MGDDKRMSMREQLAALLKVDGNKEDVETGKTLAPRKPAKKAATEKAKKANRKTATKIALSLAEAKVPAFPLDKPKALAPTVEASSAPQASSVRPRQVNLASAILQGDADLNLVRERLAGMVFRGETEPATSISDESKASLTRYLSVGSELLLKRPDPDEVGYIVGFDFGTSSSKIVFHQPGAGDPAYAMPIPWELRVEERGRRQDHLWRTVIWFDPTLSRFFAFPAAGAMPIEGFKTRLLQSDASELLPGVTAAEAATAYLASVFAYAVGHYHLDAPEGFRKDSHFASFHFGVPVASMEDGDCADVFRRVANAAVLVAGQADTLQLKDVRAALEVTDPSGPVTGQTSCVLFEELSAVVAGYRASPDHSNGPHVIVDIGASTLDIATFNVLAGDSFIPVLYTSVELLGADAHSAATQRELDDDLFVRACQAQTEQVLTITRTRRDPQFASKNGVPKPMLFVGGGRLDPIYEQIYRAYEAGLGAPRRTPLPGKNLSYDQQTDFSRLLLAWGLSQEDIRLPPIKPPSQIEDFSSPPRRGSGNGFVSKDDC